jgi:hypothetical protein
MRGMKLQFSLTTMLIGITVLGVISAVVVALPVYEEKQVTITTAWKTYDGQPVYTLATKTEGHAPTGRDISWRLLIWGPLAVAGVLAVLYGIRGIKIYRNC